MPIIEVNRLTKIFGHDPKRALPYLEQKWTKEKIAKELKLTVGVNQVSFAIEQGEIFVIMGLSGSGKSTLVRLLNRLIEPTAGQVLIAGQDIVRMGREELRQVRRKTISMVFQKFALFPHRTVLENVEYGLEIQGVDKKARREKAMNALQLVGLKGWEDHRPDQLSGGMQQRVGLARGLANDPDILLMDEAFSALDPLIRKDMQDELLELQARMKKTIVFITHDLDEALRLGDRIALMKDGSIVQIGTPEEILTNPANDYVERFVEDVDLSKVLTASQANDYVERFVEDVDLSKVLTASHVMKRPVTMTPDRGPRVALQFMRENGISNIYLVDESRKLLGAVTAEDASDAVRTGKKMSEIVIQEVPVVSPDTRLNEMFDLVSQTRVPVAVTDKQGRLLGIVVRGAVLAALAGVSDTEGSEQR
jgi:glycine betaine/L-proline transport ATP binding subunit